MADTGGSKEQPALVCRNVTVNGRRTSLRMEPYIWDSLRDICERERMSVNLICSEIDHRRGAANLTAALRVFIISYYRSVPKMPMGLHEQPPEDGGLSNPSHLVREALKTAIPLNDE